jgi:hypothetical protein
MTRQDPTFTSRTLFGALAALIGILVLWIVTADLVSPRAMYFPSNADEAKDFYASRDSATTAAQIGVIRGDLWTKAAVARAAALLFGANGNHTPQAEIADAQRIGERAARLSPHDSRIWLVLAGLDARLGAGNAKIAELLKLSYYTGPNVLSLVPLRLLLAAQSDAIGDDELQSLVQLDIQHIVEERPDLKPAIAIAYKSAQPKGRELIGSTLQKIDPALLAAFAGSVPAN